MLPLYCVSVLRFGLMVCTKAISGVLPNPPPIPNGVAAWPNVGSFVPNGTPVSGDPIFNPCEPLVPIALQSTPCVSPANEHGSGMILEKAVPSPGNDNNALAMLPGGARVRNCGVSAQVLLVLTEL